VRDVPAAQRERHDDASLQFNWDVSRDLALYWGLRYGSVRGEDPAAHGRGRELYLKASYSLRR